MGCLHPREAGTATQADADHDDTGRRPVRLTEWRAGFEIGRVLFLSPLKEVGSLPAPCPAPETPCRIAQAGAGGVSQTLARMAAGRETPRCRHRAEGGEAGRLALVAPRGPLPCKPSRLPISQSSIRISSI